MVAKQKTTAKKTAKKTVAKKKTGKKTTRKVASKKTVAKTAVTEKQAAAASTPATTPPTATQQKAVADKVPAPGFASDTRQQRRPVPADEGMGIGMLAAGLAGAALVAYLGYSILLSNDASEIAQATTDHPAATASSDAVTTAPTPIADSAAPVADSGSTPAWTPPEAGLFAGGAGGSAHMGSTPTATTPSTSSIFANELTGHSSGAGMPDGGIGLGSGSGVADTDPDANLDPEAGAFAPPPPPYGATDPWSLSGADTWFGAGGTPGTDRASDAEADASDIYPRGTRRAPVTSAYPFPAPYPPWYRPPYPPPYPGYYWRPRGAMPIPPPYYW